MVNRHQPYKVERFEVDLGDYDVSDFVEVKMPNSTTEVNEYRTGDDSAHSRKLWGSTQNGELVMTRGADDIDDLLQWRRLVNDGKIEEAKVDIISVTLKSETYESGPRWTFTNAWPREYHPPTLSSGGSKVAMETIVIAYDEMKRDA
ncbi:phage tail protein [Natronobiforma cellulositropha]|uniref:phage tail protein n=1 Tax=Natronobiforma cellulositropha TaxID=1679076 RepID=UPI0021D5FF21|nr:phage tail protein [Natronobiforma cellulositropha]